MPGEERPGVPRRREETGRMSLLAVIPARAGSKGVPGKNSITIAGQPLIEHSVRAAERSTSVSGIVVTTDDEEILRLYETRASVFTVRRPDVLAADDAPTSAAVAHALDAAQAAAIPEPTALILLQPTTPMRTAEDIDAAYGIFEESHGIGGVVSVCRVDGIRHPRVMYRRGQDGRGELMIADDEDRLTRHDYEPLYQRNGAIYIVSTDFFRREGKMRGLSPLLFEMPWERSINIDTHGDLILAKALMESGLLEDGGSVG